MEIVHSSCMAISRAGTFYFEFSLFFSGHSTEFFPHMVPYSCATAAHAPGTTFPWRLPAFLSESSVSHSTPGVILWCVPISLSDSRFLHGQNSRSYDAPPRRGSRETPGGRAEKQELTNRDIWSANLSVLAL
ncbi:hypothetical protein B0H12DRAFT_142423 [Mycena haematopus]|nr:hypothetical protein B0H12DRAFT_142423 [Mycena haematopus]